MRSMIILEPAFNVVFERLTGRNRKKKNVVMVFKDIQLLPQQTWNRTNWEPPFTTGNFLEIRWSDSVVFYAYFGPY